MNYPILALIIANIIWGASAPISKFALQNIPPFTFAFIRFFVASFIFLPGAIVTWRNITIKEFFTIVVAGFFGIFINISFYFLGLKSGISINAPIIASAGPVFLFLLAVLILKEKLHPKVFMGMLLSFFGVVIIVFSPFFIDGSTPVKLQTTANMFFVFSTLGAIIDALIAKQMLKKFSPFQFIFIAFFFPSLLFVPFARHELVAWSFSQLTTQGLTGIIFGIFFASAIAYSFFYWGISKISAQEIGVFTYIDPVAALLIAGPLLGEYPTIYYILGSLFVFGGIFLAEGRLHWHPLHKLRRPRHSEA